MIDGHKRESRALSCSCRLLYCIWQNSQKHSVAMIHVVALGDKSRSACGNLSSFGSLGFPAQQRESLVVCVVFKTEPNLARLLVTSCILSRPGLTRAICPH